MKAKAITVLGIVVLLIAPTCLFADSITINITAEVEYVDDMGNVLNGLVNEGDIIMGQYIYESTTLDSNSLPTVGDFWHYSSPYGISLEINGLNFETDPSDTQFLVEIVNDHYDQDNYLLRSYKNLPLALPDGVIVEHISWQLDDPTATALSSEALPADPPALENWQSIFGLSINGFIPDPYIIDLPLFGTEYFIRAHVTSATIVLPEIYVDIDIKPNSYDNCFTYNEQKWIPVVIIGEYDFDVYDIDLDTIRLEGLSIRKVGGKGKLLTYYEDTNDDQIDDLYLVIDNSNKVFEEGESQATLIGSLYDDTLIEGTDMICILP